MMPFPRVAIFSVVCHNLPNTSIMESMINVEDSNPSHFMTPALTVSSFGHLQKEIEHPSNTGLEFSIFIANNTTDIVESVLWNREGTQTISNPWQTAQTLVPAIQCVQWSNLTPTQWLANRHQLTLLSSKPISYSIRLLLNMQALNWLHPVKSFLNGQTWKQLRCLLTISMLVAITI